MPPETHAPLEDVILAAVADRLEAALDHASSADAVRHLGEIARLCREAKALAEAGALVLDQEA